ncbi:hypothetical protein P3G55_20115 [Leptospira sp. 96542]|nr:hypothetical protein [Leptospira sp. 96542]
MEFIKVRNERGEIKYLSVRNIISFRAEPLPQTKDENNEIGFNPSCLVLDLVGNNRAEAFGSADEIGSIVSALCEPSDLQKSIETAMDKFLNPPERETINVDDLELSPSQTFFGSLEERFKKINEQMAEALESIGERINYLESGLDALKESAGSKEAV